MCSVFFFSFVVYVVFLLYYCAYDSMTYFHRYWLQWWYFAFITWACVMTKHSVERNEIENEIHHRKIILISNEINIDFFFAFSWSKCIFRPFCVYTCYFWKKKDDWHRWRMVNILCGFQMEIWTTTLTIGIIVQFHSALMWMEIQTRCRWTDIFSGFHGLSHLQISKGLSWKIPNKPEILHFQKQDLWKNSTPSVENW